MPMMIRSQINIGHLYQGATPNLPLHYRKCLMAVWEEKKGVYCIQAYLSSIQRINLTLYKFLANSFPMTHTNLINLESLEWILTMHKPPPPSDYVDY